MKLMKLSGALLIAITSLSALASADDIIHSSLSCSAGPVHILVTKVHGDGFENNVMAIKTEKNTVIIDSLISAGIAGKAQEGNGSSSLVVQEENTVLKAVKAKARRSNLDRGDVKVSLVSKSAPENVSGTHLFSAQLELQLKASSKNSGEYQQAEKISTEVQCLFSSEALSVE